MSIPGPPHIEPRDALQQAEGVRMPRRPEDLLGGPALDERAAARFAVMEALRRESSLDALAEALEVSKSGFYAHLRKSEGLRRRGDKSLRPLIRSSFEQSRATYGCLRIRWDLRERGERCGKNRVARLMREQGLRPTQKRRFRPCTTQSRHNYQIAENWLAKVPAPDRPGRLWQSDITATNGWIVERTSARFQNYRRLCIR